MLMFAMGAGALIWAGWMAMVPDPNVTRIGIMALTGFVSIMFGFGLTGR